MSEMNKSSTHKYKKPVVCTANSNTTGANCAITSTAYDGECDNMKEWSKLHDMQNTKTHSREMEPRERP